MVNLRDGADLVDVVGLRQQRWRALLRRSRLDLMGVHRANHEIGELAGILL